MSTTVQGIQANLSATAANDSTISQQITRLGEHAVLASTVTVLAWIGAMKFTAYEAGAIEGLVASSPLTAWLYSVFSLQGASNLIGSVEIATALVLLIGIRYRPAAIVGALAAIATFAVTLSFLFTAPGWEASLGGFPALSVVPGQFLLKDAVLLAAAISLLGKALSRQH
ncbi:YkgB family protein [Granulosicoccus sp. 3-233]|uniref:YkgB family protein n=1 Tax=Granulosicoccus sp. 3-233 TaxID=3417969 RepID=UPI003D333B7A